jgi:hypothetical protein
MENHGKSPFSMGKLTTNGPFSMAMLNYQRVYYYYIIIILLLLYYYYYDINVAITCLIATGDQCGDFFWVLEIPLTDRPFWGYFPIGDHILHDSVAKVTRSSAV